MAAEEEVKAMLVGASVTTTGLIFIGDLPERTPDLCLAIRRPAGGLRPEKKFGSAAIGYDRPRLQLVARGDVNDYVSGRALIDAAYAACAAVQASTLSGTLYHALEPEHPPIYAGEDKNKRPVFVLNVQAVREP